MIESMEKQKQKLHPFLSSEKRFELTHSFINGNDLELNHKMKPSKYKKDYYNIRKKFVDDYNKIDFTKRVILPQKNTEKAPPSKLRIYTQLGKDLLRVGEGSYTSLMVRTPMSFPVKGRKRINKSVDCGNKPDAELFWEDKIEECSKNNDRLFGVERKFRTKLINIESEDKPYKAPKKIACFLKDLLY